MNWFRGAAFALAAVLSAVPVVAQGIPETRAYVERQKGWEAISDGRHQDTVDAFAPALDAEPRDPLPPPSNSLRSCSMAHLSQALLPDLTF